MCPHTNVLAPLVPKINVPCDTMSLDCYIPVITHYTTCLGYVMENDRDVLIQGHCVSGAIYLGGQRSQKICMGTHRFGFSCHPTIILCFKNRVPATSRNVMVFDAVSDSFAYVRKVRIRPFTCCLFCRFLYLWHHTVKCRVTARKLRNEHKVDHNYKNIKYFPARVFISVKTFLPA